MTDFGADRKTLEWAFANIPQLQAFSIDDFDVTALPGYTNRNYRLCHAEQDWVLRLPQAHTNQLIDRRAEAHNQSRACERGLAPPVAWRNRAGITLTSTITTGRAPTEADLRSADSLTAIVKAFQALHRSGLQFHGGLGVRDTLEQHYGLLSLQQQKHFAGRMSQARRILALLQQEAGEVVPSHRDPVLANLLFEGERLWLIDWEYSAMASPYWDLAILCNEAELDLAQSQHLLRLYCVDGSPMQESTLFDYRGLLKLLNDCWMAALARS